jgi:hypothetical protein
MTTKKQLRKDPCPICEGYGDSIRKLKSGEIIVKCPRCAQVEKHMPKKKKRKV